MSPLLLIVRLFFFPLSSIDLDLSVGGQPYSDAMHCNVCETKFPTLAMRREQGKHHCRMCGLVVCHACASTYVFYAVSGKKQRTCDSCIKNGAPPSSRLASNQCQKSLFKIVMDNRKEKSIEKIKDPVKRAKAAEEFKAKSRTSDTAAHVDWGVEHLKHAPSLKASNKAAAALQDGYLKPKNAPQEATRSNVWNKESTMPFKVFFNPKAKEGDTIEVKFPGGTKVVTYIDTTTAVQNPKDTSKKA